MKEKFKIFSTIILSLVLLFSFCFNVNAEEQYTVTLEGAGKEHKFEAYQIFKGDLSTKEGEDETAILSNIEWGDGIQGDKLLSALQSAETLIDKREESGATGTAVQMSEIFSGCTTARDVAEVLALYQDDSDMARAFAELINKNLNTTKIEASYNEGEKNYTFTIPKAGYYFIKDATEKLTDSNEFYTRYILQVVKDSKLKVKGDIPTLEKKVAETDKGKDSTTPESDSNLDEKKALSAEVGEALKFTLYGTLPTNYTDYETYKYIFHDTLSKGLTLKEDSIKVYKFSKEGNEEIKECTDQDPENKGCYKKEVKQPTEPEGITELKVTIDNLKEVVPDLNYSKEKDYKIVVIYYAYLNENAVVGKDGNTNTAYLEYSNNPNEEGAEKTGQTPEEKNTVYTYQLEIDKKDGKKETFLKGVGFKLYKKVESDSGEKRLYAKMKNGTGENNQPYILEGWTEEISQATELFTGENGKLNIKGLEANTYYLKETTTLAGYNTIDDVTVVIKDEMTGNEENALSQELTSLQLTVSWTDNEKPKNDNEANGDKDTGIVKTTILNMPGSILPFTGGAGTVIFYVVGVALVVIAGVLIYKKVKSNKGNKNNPENNK